MTAAPSRRIVKGEQAASCEGAACVLRGPALVESRGVWERDGVRRWDFGAMPDGTRVRSAGVMLTMYPAIDDAGEAGTVGLAGGDELQGHGRGPEAIARAIAGDASWAAHALRTGGELELAEVR